jgi:RNA polymerase sigma-70 factor (ECF subfamily)
MTEVANGVLTPDETLIVLAREGDRAALEELFRRHFDVAYGVAYRFLGQEQDAQDAVQDGFLKAVRHLADFDGRSVFRTWLLRIVQNAALDTGRRRKRRPALALITGLGDEPAQSDDPAANLQRQDLRRLLDKALSRLSPTIRTTIVLFAEAGLSYKEIADVQNVPIGTVMSRIHYARTKLQDSLDLDGIEGR